MKIKILICLVSLLIGLSACGSLGEKAENSEFC